MATYVTPARFNVMGFGSDAVPDNILRSILVRASRAADTYCAVPMVPSRYSFLGGSVTNEEHPFRLSTEEAFGRRVRLYCTPLKSVSDLKIYVTNQQYVQFPAGELFVTKNWVEIVSLAMTASGLFGAAIVPNIGLGTPILKAAYSYGYSFTEGDETLGSSDLLTYRAANQFWDATQVTVKRDGAEITTGFTIDRNEGTVTFATIQLSSSIITASYGYTLPSAVAEAVGYIAADMLSDKSLVESGVGGLRSLHVDEITIEREPVHVTRQGGQVLDPVVPDHAASLLDPFRFFSAF
jgi:hypothetical protein